MAALSYARPRLTTPEDRRYREHVERFVLQRKNQRAIRPPRQRDIFGGQAEETLRAWLAEHYDLSERRILEYEQRQNKRATMKYRELDAVVLEDKRTISVFEVKASRVSRSVRRAVAQLQETRAILRLLYPTVRATVLLVDTGIPTAEEIVALMASEDAPKEPPETLAEVLASLEAVQLVAQLEERSRDGSMVDVLLFGVDDIIALAGEEHLALDWSDDDEEAPLPPTEPTSHYTSSEEAGDSDDEDGGTLADALRRAGLGS
jgi:hypothetical protein